MKKKFTALYLFLPLAMLAVTVGCKGWLLGSQPYQDVKYYGLRTPSPLPDNGTRINVLMLKTLDATKGKMLYRDSSYVILQDDYNKWVQSPAFMLRQYLQAAFNNDNSKAIVGDANCYYLSDSIVTFEINLPQKEVILSMDYRLQAATNREVSLEYSRTIREPFREETPAAFAEAMSQAADKLSRIIQLEAEVLHKHAAAIEKARAEKEKTAAAKAE